MKRDMGLIRNILLMLEDEINPSACTISIPDVPEHVVNYHLALLVEAGLVDGLVSAETGTNPSIPRYVRVYRITWSGHEFIDNFRNDDVWNTLKSEFKEMSFSSMTSIGKQLLEGFAKKKIESLITTPLEKP